MKDVPNALVDNGVFLSFDDMIVVLILIRRCSFAFFLLSGIAYRVLVDIRRTLDTSSAVLLRRNGLLLALS
jgi:hypothetical protein